MDLTQIKKYFPFKTPRQGQLELIKQIIDGFNSGKKHIILNAPTGWGKSVIAYTVGKYFGGCYILTSQKCLQEQYYSDLQIPFVMGRSNYICKRNKNLTCEFGVCKRKPESFCVDCPYLLNKDNALNSEIGDLNYSYFLTLAASLNAEVPRKKLLVCDECHNLESELINMCSLKISEKLLVYLGIFVSLPDKSSDYNDKISWLLNRVAPKLREQKIYFKGRVEAFKAFKISREYKQMISKYFSVMKLLSAISEIEKQNNLKSKLIITRSSDDILEYKLLFANHLFNEYISNNADYILHMSATIFSKTEYCKSLGINQSDALYIETESFFPLENRIIHYDPIGSLSYKNKFTTIPKLLTKIDQLLNYYKDVKGIIHTGNYEIAEIIIDNLSSSKNGNRLLMPRGENRQEILNEFYNSNFPCVLISPSLTEGLDLKDDLSRFCIICKVPYASLADTWTKERLNLNPNWYLNNTAQILVQMTGRSIRSETDFCNTYILDSDFLQFASRAINILPKWWKDSVK